MKKNDLLRVKNVDVYDDEIVKVVYEAKETVQSDGTFLNKAPKNKTQAVNIQSRQVKNGFIFNKTVFILLFLCVTFILLYFFSLFIQKIVCILVLSVFTAFIVPITSIILINDLNKRKKISYSYLFGGFLFGSIIFAFVDSFYMGVITKLTYLDLQMVLKVVISNVFLFGVSLIYSIIVKSKNIFDTMIIVVSVYLGYAFTDNLINSFSSILLDPSVNVGINKSMNTILNGKEIFMSSLSRYLSYLFDFSVLCPLCYFLWGVIHSCVIYVSTVNVKMESLKVLPMYLLSLVALVLNIIICFETSSVVLNYTLKTICLIFSLFMSIYLINFAFKIDKASENNIN